MKRNQPPDEFVPEDAPEYTCERKAMMALLAHAHLEELASGLMAFGLQESAVTELRPPQVGLVMVRGRQGATGKPSNLGEATVTRAAVQTADGLTGVSYVLGRAPEKARLAAQVDALWQSTAHRPAIEKTIIEPVRERLFSERRTKRRQTAATTVDFFTMVRGDD